jgi:hypothetical protein
MEIRTFRCDNCGKLRVNDEPWWIVVSTERESFTVLPWGHHFPNNGNMTLCSQACIFQLLSEFLVGQVWGSVLKTQICKLVFDRSSCSDTGYFKG